MSAIKEKLYRVRSRLNLKWFGAFLLIVIFAYLGHQNLINMVIVPAYNWLYGTAIGAAVINFLKQYAGTETWNWHSISASAMIGIIAVVFGYFWGRHSIEVVEVNSPTPEKTILKREESGVETKTPSDTDAKIAELTKQVEDLKKEKAAE